MATLQPVKKSEMYLTEVQTDGAHARYFFDSYIYDFPNTFMQVAATGFLNPTNNITGDDITAVNLSPFWFEVIDHGQVNESADGIARSGTTNGATCKQITKPLKTQSIVLTDNLFGCMMRQKRKKKRIGAQSRTGTFGNVTLPNIFAFNKAIFAIINRYWRTPGPPGGIQQWIDKAAVNPVMNYKGVRVTMTAKQYWVLANKYHSNADFIPGGQITPEDFSPIFTVDPDNWTPPNPIINSVTVDADGETLIRTPWEDNFVDCIMQPLVSPRKRRSAKAQQTSKFVSGQNEVNQDGGEAEWSMNISYPFFPDGISGPVTFAVRIFDFTRWTFSDLVSVTAGP